MTRERRIQLINFKFKREAIKYHMEYYGTKQKGRLYVDLIEEEEGRPMIFHKSTSDQEIAKELVDVIFEEQFGCSGQKGGMVMLKREVK